MKKQRSMLEIRLTITWPPTPRTALAFLMIGLMAGLPLELGSETLTLSTQYPSPAGVYSSLVVTGGSVGSPKNTLFNTIAGAVGIGTSNPNPARKMDVFGDVHLSGDLFIGVGPNLQQVSVCQGGSGTGTLATSSLGCIPGATQGGSAHLSLLH